jgi:transcription termination factor Rho
MSDMPDRALLESKERDELLQIAAALGVEVAPRARKNTIIGAILAPEGEASAGENESDGSADAEAASEAPAVTKRTRTPAPPRDASDDAGPEQRAAVSDSGASAEGATEVQGEAGDAADSETAASDVPVAEEGNRRSRRRGRGRDDAQIAGETVHCDGLLDLRDEGYGFLRTNGPLPSADDVYVAARQVRQYDLRRGDRITGVSRPAARSERNPALLRLDTLNGEPPPEQPERPLFDDLTPVLPTDALPLAGEQGAGALAAIDSLSLIGLGSRGLLTASGTRSASPLIASMAAAIGDQHPDLHLIVLLIAERPEDVTDMTRRLETSGEVLASTFDRPPEEHLAVAELTLERTKRMAEAGADVVILFDGLTRLARAYAAGGNGRHQPADTVGAAITSTLRFFGGARNLEDAGSITMVATARTSTGNQVDDLVAARLREAANLEIALGEGLPGIADLNAGDVSLDGDGSFSLGDHR